MKTFFPNFEEVFGHTDKLKVVLQSRTVPVLTIQTNQTIVKMGANIMFLNPLNEAFEVINIEVDLTASV